MKHLYATLLFSLLTTSFFAQAPTKYEEVNQQLDSLMQATLVMKGKRAIPNFLLYAKKGEHTFYKGAGIVGRNNTAVAPDYQFKIASITKTFVAVVTLQLIEEGKLDYEDKVYPYLSKIDYLNFDKFHLLEGKPYARDITVAQLLRHNSGIADIFTDKETRFVLRVLLKKDRSYTLKDVIDLYYQYKLHEQPLNVPGAGYHYSDMNYMLLGFTIQEITGHSLAENIRQRILEPLEMTNTYFEYYEAARGTQKQIDAYLNRLNITKKVNTSYEWAGGGLISTTEDLGTFAEALFQGKLFQSKSTLETMTDLSYNERFHSGAGMGIFRYDIGERVYFGHGGFYGSLMLYSPTDQVTIVANIGQANPGIDARRLMDQIGDFLHTLP